MTISLPAELLAQVDQLAAEDDRSRSKWVVRELKKIVAQKMSGKKTPIIYNPGASDSPSVARVAETLVEREGGTPRARPTMPGIRKIVEKEKPKGG